MEKLNEQQNTELLKAITKDVLERLGYEAEINVVCNEKDPELKIVAINSTENLSALIGKNGQNIKALEQVVRLLYFKKSSGPAIQTQGISFSIDLNDYRKLRAKQVVERAVEAANRVRNSKKAEALLPMSSFERRLIHVELASCPDIETESIGEEPQRRIVIKPLII